MKSYVNKEINVTLELTKLDMQLLRDMKQIKCRLNLSHFENIEDHQITVQVYACEDIDEEYNPIAH